MYDVYPDIAVVAKVLKQDSITAKALFGLQRYLWQNTDRILTVGRDMQSLVWERINHDDKKVSVIPLFSSTDEISPESRKDNAILKDNDLLDSFVVQVSGNIGPVHNVEALMESARLLEDTPDIKFLIIGSGKKIPWVKDLVHLEKRKNVIVLPRMPREKSCDFLNACDIAISALFVPGMWGLANPSRTYGIMAAGKPMIAMADSGTEVARLIEEQKIGWRVSPGDVEGLTASIRDAYDNRAELDEMGNRARRAAETIYNIDRIISMHFSFLDSEVLVERQDVVDENEIDERAAYVGQQKLVEDGQL